MRKFSIRTCLIGLLVTTLGLMFLIPRGNGLLVLGWCLLYACFLPNVIIEIIDWATGRGRRAALFGVGWQANWTHAGIKVRGDVDENGELWISVADCALASLLPLEKRLDWVATTQKRHHPVKGWLVTKSAALALLNSPHLDRAEFVQVAKLRTFLEREVWHQDEKTRQTATVNHTAE